MSAVSDLARQHLIDPEICIRCNTCEETCPVDAITHDARNYVVNPGKCDGCNACIAPCPTGAIDSWRQVAKKRLGKVGGIRMLQRVVVAPLEADARERVAREPAPADGTAVVARINEDVVAQLEQALDRPV